MLTIIKKAVFASIITLAVLASAGAQPYGQGKGHGVSKDAIHSQNRQAAIENILPDLTEEQKSALKELRVEQMKVMKDLRNQMGEIRAKKRTIMSDYPIDLKKAENIIDEQTALMNKQLKAQAAHQAALKEILTEEQVLTLEAQRMHKRHLSARAEQGQRRGGNFSQGMRQKPGQWQ